MIRIAEEGEKSNESYDEITRHLLAVVHILDKELGHTYVCQECHKKTQELVFWIQHGFNLKKDNELV